MRKSLASALEEARMNVAGLMQQVGGKQKIISPIADEVISPVPNGPVYVSPTPTTPPVGNFHPSTPKELMEVIKVSSEKNSIPSRHFSNLLAQESMQFNKDVIAGKRTSPVGAIGVAQFMPKTAAWWSKTYGQFDPKQPQQAIPAAAAYLNYLNKKFGSLPATYAAYNAGEGRVRSALEQANDFREALKLLPIETQNYVIKVLGTDEF